MYTKEELVKPFSISGGSTGVLLIHGFTAAPIDLKPIGESLAGLGYTVRAPLLPGHGTSPEDMSETNWNDWFNHVQKQARQLRQSCTKIAALGHSMGGLLVLQLAAEGEADAVISINAPIIYRNRDMHYIKRLKEEFVNKPNKTQEIKVTKGGLPHFSYTRVPVNSMISLNEAITPVQNRLRKITCPSLIIQGLEDDTVHPRSGRMIEKSITRAPKEIIYWENGDHYLPLSAQKDEMLEKISVFLEKYELTP